ncbi:MEDS domain-containing protein [Spirillospora sp. NPDC048911]|uniref:MEDS domain-containing protein n=1 Tax=Spirillospora sp. NPDC048911 TaxID=3364527 RepID=UPI0037230F9B
METLVSTRRPVRELRPGDHALLTFADDDEQRYVAGAFVRDGLAAGDKVIYLAETARARIPGVVVPPPPGRLSVVALDALNGRSFQPHAVIEALRDEVRRAEDEGHGTIRVTADMTWALRRPNGLELLLGSEQDVERAIGPSTSVIAICAFDRRHCTPGELAALRQAHSVVVEPDPEFEDAVFRIVRTFAPTGLALSGELDASRHIVLNNVLVKLLSSVNGSAIHLDLAGLGFIDLGAINMLADVAARRAGHGPLVLDRMSPQLRTVMETVGWHMLPGLRLGDDG